MSEPLKSSIWCEKYSEKQLFTDVGILLISDVFLMFFDRLGLICVTFGALETSLKFDDF